MLKYHIQERCVTKSHIWVFLMFISFYSSVYSHSFSALAITTTQVGSALCSQQESATRHQHACPHKTWGVLSNSASQHLYWSEVLWRWAPLTKYTFELFSNQFMNSQLYQIPLNVSLGSPIMLCANSPLYSTLYFSV